MTSVPVSLALSTTHHPTLPPFLPQVSIGYRLGPLGFLVMGQGDDEGQGNGGMNGIHDQIVALQWMRKHIAGANDGGKKTGWERGEVALGWERAEMTCWIGGGDRQDGDCHIDPPTYTRIHLGLGEG